MAFDDRRSLREEITFGVLRQRLFLSAARTLGSSARPGSRGSFGAFAGRPGGRPVRGVAISTRLHRRRAARQPSGDLF